MEITGSDQASDVPYDPYPLGLPHIASLFSTGAQLLHSVYPEYHLDWPGHEAIALECQANPL